MYDAIHLRNFVLCCACGGLKLWEIDNSLDDFAEDTPRGSEKSCSWISSHGTATSVISCASRQCFSGGTLFRCWNGRGRPELGLFYLEVERFHERMQHDRLFVLDIDFQPVPVRGVGFYMKTVATIEVADDDGTIACDIEVGECHRLVAKKADSPKKRFFACKCLNLSTHLLALRHHATQCEGCTAVTAGELIKRFRQHEESGHEKDSLMCSDGKLRSICNATASTNREKVWRVVFEDRDAIVSVHVVPKGKPLDTWPNMLVESFKEMRQLHVLAFGDLNPTRRGGQRQKPDTGLEHAGDP